LGFNCVRLVNSLDLIYLNPVVAPDRLAANPDLMNKTALEIHDEVVNALTDANVMVILNNHMSNAGWCCSYEDGNGLWYTDEYPEEVFFDHWFWMAERYRHNPLVIGADLRNEIRGILDETIPGGKLYATWGLGLDSTDWNKAAEKAAIRVHEGNPDMLIIVGGIFTGGILTPAALVPVRIPDQSKLVYEGHIYDGTPIISDLPYPEFDEGMTWMQRFVEIVGQNCTAPFWMGEFGTGSNSVNWQKMIRFIREHDLDWAIWPIDGYQYGRGNEGYGILMEDFKTVRHPWKMEQLREMMICNDCE